MPATDRAAVSTSARRPGWGCRRPTIGWRRGHGDPLRDRRFAASWAGCSLRPRRAASARSRWGVGRRPDASAGARVSGRSIATDAGARAVDDVDSRPPDRQEAALDLPLDVQATAFQWQVWQALAAIPYGDTRTYADVAAAIGRPRAARAVARACAANPVALAIPCHRVVPGRAARAAIAGGRSGRRRCQGQEGGKQGGGKGKEECGRAKGGRQEGKAGRVGGR